MYAPYYIKTFILLYFIDSNDPMILGSNNSNLPAVISLIADAAYGQSFEMCPEVAKRLVNICKSVQVCFLWRLLHFNNNYF